MSPSTQPDWFHELLASAWDEAVAASAPNDWRFVVDTVVALMSEHPKVASVAISVVLSDAGQDLREFSQAAGLRVTRLHHGHHQRIVAFGVERDPGAAGPGT